MGPTFSNSSKFASHEANIDVSVVDTPKKVITVRLENKVNHDEDPTANKYGHNHTKHSNFHFTIIDTSQPDSSIALTRHVIN